MKIVKNIEIIECDNMEEYRTLIPQKIFDFANEAIFNPWEKIEFIEETIKPKIFMNQNKERVCIGFTKQAEETLGIVMTSFQKITNENQELKKENYFLKNQISRTNKSSFVKKIKFIFFGMD